MVLMQVEGLVTEQYKNQLRYQCHELQQRQRARIAQVSCCMCHVCQTEPSLDASLFTCTLLGALVLGPLARWNVTQIADTVRLLALRLYGNAAPEKNSQDSQCLM